MRTDPSSIVVALIFLAVGVLAVAAIIIKRRNGDVLHGDYIKRHDKAR
jgi:hypothetical protein